MTDGTVQRKIKLVNGELYDLCREENARLRNELATKDAVVEAAREYQSAWEEYGICVLSIPPPDIERWTTIHNRVDKAKSNMKAALAALDAEGGR